MPEKRDHGGGLDAAILRFGGTRETWMDLSTGINPVPYPFTSFPPDAWTALPDQAAQTRLTNAARTFWEVPEGADILAAPGASCLIAAMPSVADGKTVQISGPTYNEHAAAFEHAGWTIRDSASDVRIVVHPNNPDGRLWEAQDPTPRLTIIDESFCDVMPKASQIARTAQADTIVLKSFGKFWGLAGLRLGFAIGPQGMIETIRQRMGPWPVAGPALRIGAQALNDYAWAQDTRTRLQQDADRLDRMLTAAGADVVGGTTLFRLYHVDDASAWQTRLAEQHIWSRIFPYSKNWLRLGLPHPMDWARLEEAL